MRAGQPAAGGAPADPRVVPIFTAQGACSGCEYSRAKGGELPPCHMARQRVMDLRGIGRHTSCPYYVEFQAQLQQAAAVVQRLAPRQPWWRRLLGG